MRKLFHCLTIVLSLFLIFTSSSFAKTINILVHPFENTGDNEYSWVSAGMTDTVIADLTRIKNIIVVSNADRKKILEEMKFIFSGLAEEEKMIKLGKITGANVIFTGSYLVSGNRIRVHARLVNVELGKVESSTKIDGTLNGIFDLQDKVVFTLMGETEKITVADIKPVKITEQDKKKIEEKPRPSVTAYEWYAKGLERQDTNPNEALTNFKKALDVDPNYTDALINAGRITAYPLSLFEEAHGYFERADRVMKDRNETNTIGYAMLRMSVGSYFSIKGQYNRGLEYCLNAKSKLDNLNLQNTVDYYKIMGNIGYAYAGKGQHDRSLEYELNAKAVLDSLGLQNTAYYAKSMINIGASFRRKGQHDRGLEYHLNAKAVLDSLGLQNTAYYATLMANTGLFYSAKGQVDRGLEYCLKAKSILAILGLQNTVNYAEVMQSVGVAYWINGQVDRGLEYCLKAKSIRDRLGLQNTSDYARLLDVLASLYEAQGKRDMAGRYYRMAYDTFVQAAYFGTLKDKALNNATRLGY